ncbi:RodZ domain-containing protein [Simiduia aestuariiviva]|uniref:Cytoskeleton protein RodZ n=1 Tax=Simiduia aestuariiviva TaxID=1510459 RepID=A0A839UK32_9GAMM|nr:RodZ domain-containing protein [Simiduia aestuariiviva]MBB3167973.1 cytoskeleton protein RodZ [Simiduia aestuariiviva]
MTAETNNETPVEESVDLLTPGGFLQKEREEQKLNEKEVATKLRITRSKLAALETDSYDQFPGETFIKGYLRAYSRLLKLDEDAVLQRYFDYVSAHSEVSQLITPSRPQGVVSAMAVERMKTPISPLVWIGFIALLAIVVVWFALQDSASTANVDETVSVAEQVGQAVTETQVEGALDAENLATESAQADPVVQPDQMVAADDVIQPSAPQAVETKRAASDVQAAGALELRAPDRLELQFADECWVEISDANGDVLATELQAAGSAITLQGKAPFNVMLGNVKAATLALNGQSVEVTPKGNNRALRFVVGSSNQ